MESHIFDFLSDSCSTRPSSRARPLCNIRGESMAARLRPFGCHRAPRISQHTLSLENLGQTCLPRTLASLPIDCPHHLLCWSSLQRSVSFGVMIQSSSIYFIKIYILDFLVSCLSPRCSIPRGHVENVLIGIPICSSRLLHIGLPASLVNRSRARLLNLLIPYLLAFLFPGDHLADRPH